MHRANWTVHCGLLILSTFHAATVAAAQVTKKQAPSAKKPAASTPSPAAALNKRLCDAVRAGDPAKVKALLAAGAAVNSKESASDMTPLMLATTSPNTAIITLLLDAGADVNIQSKDGTTALMLICFSGEPEHVKLLLDHGAKVDARADTDETALFSAVLGNPAIVQLLLEHGADVNWMDKRGMTPLVLVASVADRTTPHLDAARQLMKKGADVNARGKSDPAFTPLEAAAKQDNVELAKLLLENGADVNRPGAGGLTPLMAACYYANPEIVKMLLAAKANVNAVGMEGGTALVMAWGAEPDGVPQDAAAKTRRREIMRQLLDNGADVNARLSKEKATVLMLAAAKGDVPAVQLLVEKHADVNARTTDGYTPLKLATKAKQAKVIALLKQAGAKE